MASYAIGVPILLVSLGSMVYVLRKGLRQGADARRVQSGPLAQLVDVTTLRTNWAGAITDPGQMAAQALQQALSIHPHTDADDDEEDEGVGRQLGLTYHRFRNLGDDSDPAVLDGVRNGRQVWIRLGRSYKLVMGPGLGMRRMRMVSVLRAATPAFELNAVDGRFAGTAVPPAVAEVLAGLAPAPDVWHDLRVVAGPDGIVVSRGYANDFSGGWPYDLWLLERIAYVLDALSLPHVELGREWDAPYDLGEWAPSLRDTVGGKGTTRSSASRGVRQIKRSCT